ncbi:MAG: hypothetical protein KA091_01210 [Methanoregulaceae archaeon]|nr:hypothetical protein [Methanoregulaceae archaeon]
MYPMIELVAFVLFTSLVVVCISLKGHRTNHERDWHDKDRLILVQFQIIRILDCGMDRGDRLFTDFIERGTGIINE